jgi:Kdo2-lipid IVA lauroyltransferase/acyltransferase
MQALGFYIFYVFAWLLAWVPFWLLYRVSDGVSWIMYRVIPYRKDLVLKNLRNSFPGMTEREIQRIAREFYRHFLDTAIESLKLIHISPLQITKRYVFTNPGMLDPLFDRGQGVIFALGHYGNWEWAACMSYFIRHKPMAIYKKLNNPYFNDLFIGFRSKFGLEAVQMEQTLRVILDYKRKGIPTACMFLADQRPYHRDNQYWVTFLGQPTPVLLGVEKISRKTGQAVVFWHTRKVKRGYYEVDFSLVTDDPGSLPEYEITHRHVAILDEKIREKPEYWLWSHNRWKHKSRVGFGPAAPKPMSQSLT